MEKNKAGKGDGLPGRGMWCAIFLWHEQRGPNQDSDSWAKTVLHLYELSPSHFQPLGKQFMKIQMISESKVKNFYLFSSGIDLKAF